jgi:shikimate kinase
MSNVFLIGYRGCGKTSVAWALGERLGWPWYDADVELERRAGRSIKQIFAEEGEQAFRDLEQAVVADLAGHDGAVIALGGGAILREANRQAIQNRGLTVWLQASPETLLARISADPSTGDRRPNLTSQGGIAEIERLLAERSPLYAACAQHALETEGRSCDELAAQIVAWIK